MAAAAEVSAPATATVDHERPGGRRGRGSPAHRGHRGACPPSTPLPRPPPPRPPTPPPCRRPTPTSAGRPHRGRAGRGRGRPHRRRAGRGRGLSPAAAVQADDEPAQMPVTAEVESTEDDGTARPATVVADAEPAAPAEAGAGGRGDRTGRRPGPPDRRRERFHAEHAATPVEQPSETIAVAATNGTAAAETTDDFRRIQGIGPKAGRRPPGRRHPHVPAAGRPGRGGAAGDHPRCRPARRGEPGHLAAAGQGAGRRRRGGRPEALPAGIARDRRNYYPWPRRFVATGPDLSGDGTPRTRQGPRRACGGPRPRAPGRDGRA